MPGGYQISAAEKECRTRENAQWRTQRTELATQVTALKTQIRTLQAQLHRDEATLIWEQRK